MNSATARRRRIVKQYFSRLLKLVLSNIRKVRKVDFGLSVDDIFAGYEADLEKYIDAVLDDSVKTGISFSKLSYRDIRQESMPKQLADRLSFDIEKDLARNVALNAGEITDTTRRQIAIVIRDNKDDFDKTVSKIKEKFAQIRMNTQSRAETIARTELHTLSNLSAMRGAVSAGATHKEWVWSGIEREFHAEIDGQVVPIDQPFISGLGNPLMFPGDPSAPPEEVINCGCEMVNLFLSDEEAAELARG